MTDFNNASLIFLSIIALCYILLGFSSAICCFMQTKKNLEPWYEYHVFADPFNFSTFNFLPSTIPTWQLCILV